MWICVFNSPSLPPSLPPSLTPFPAAIPSLINYFSTAITTRGADLWVVPGKGLPLWESKWDELCTCSAIRGLDWFPALFQTLPVTQADLSGLTLQGLFKSWLSLYLWGLGCLSTSYGVKRGNSGFPRAIARWQQDKTEWHKKTYGGLGLMIGSRQNRWAGLNSKHQFP